MTGSLKPKRSKWGRRAAALAVFLALGFVVNMAVAWGSIAGLHSGWLGWLSPEQGIRDGNAIIGERYVWLRRRDSLFLSHVLVQSQRVWAGADVNSDREAARRKAALHGTPILEDATVIMPAWTGFPLDRVASDSAPLAFPALVVRLYPALGAHATPDDVTRIFSAFGLPFRSIMQTHVQETFVLPSGLGLTPFSPFTNRNTIVVNFWPPSASIGGKGYPLRPIWPGAILNTVFYGAILFGLWRAMVALKRRRRRRRNLCEHCRYSLAGISSATCPECGAAILPTSPLKGRGRRATPGSESGEGPSIAAS